MRPVFAAGTCAIRGLDLIKEKFVNLKFAVPLAFLCIASTTEAATKGGDTGWPQQPTSFMGITLSEPLTRQINQCIAGSYPPKLCYQEPYHGYYYDLSGLPEIGILGYSVSVMTFESEIRQMSMDLDSDDYGTIKSMLLEKYGKPKLEGAGPVRTKVGATFQNEKLLWEGDRYLVVLMRYGETIDKSSVVVINKSVADKAKESKMKKQSENSSKI